MKNPKYDLGDVLLIEDTSDNDSLQSVGFVKSITAALSRRINTVIISYNIQYGDGDIIILDEPEDSDIYKIVGKVGSIFTHGK